MLTGCSRKLWVEWLFDGERWMDGVSIHIDSRGDILSMTRERPGPDAERHACLIPGLVNAHAHLDLPALDSRPQGGFVDWIRAVIGARTKLDADAREALVLSNLQKLIESGCTCVADVDASGSSQGALSALGVEGRAYRELIGFDLGPEEARDLIESQGLDAQGGLSPHAPYSVSSALFEAARDSGWPLMIHCSETVEELRFLSEGEGPFRDLLEDLGLWDGSFEAQACSPVAWLDRLSCLGPGTLLIHVQELVSGDLAILKDTGTPVVICPGSIHYFDRDAPRISEMWEAGLTLALGTDSLSSNEELDLFGEMQRLRMLAPDLEPQQILLMATSMGGKALGIPHAGRLLPGARFDALGFWEVPEGGPDALNEWICVGRPRPDSRFLQGRDGCKGELRSSPPL